MSTVKKQLKSTLQKYEFNPSIPTLQTKNRRRVISSSGNSALVITDTRTGEQNIGEYTATFVRPEVVDTEKFIKIYMAGVEKLALLSGAGHKMFGVIYKSMIENHNNDRLFLEFNDLVYRKLWKFTQQTFINGMNDLLKNEIIFQSISSNMYFINMKYFFNGDRIDIVTSYKLKQADMFDEQELLG